MSSEHVGWMPPAQGLYDPRAEHDACGVGFVVHMKGQRSHDIVRKALNVLINLEHRGACGCEANTGDGAGILIQTPDAFLRKVAPCSLPAAGSYGAGLIFLPHQEHDRERIKSLITSIVDEEGATLVGWRDVPTDNRLVGESAVATQPVFKQLFIGSPVAGDGSCVGAEVRAQALRDPQAGRKRRRQAAAQERALAPLLLHRQPVGEDADLQGDAPGAAARADVPRPLGPRPPVLAGARTPALQHEHVPVVAAGASRTATSRTTARSTRCAATSTGCAPARGCCRATCSATISRRCCRSSARVAATRPPSTTSSSCS